MCNLRSCLVVEDSPTQALALQALLDRNGYEVRVAVNGREALKLLEEFRPTVVVSDIIMPEMDGFELCRRLKTDERLRHISVLLLTTLSDPEDVFRALECGADNFVTKPAKEAQILSRLEYLIANQRDISEDSPRAGIEVNFAGKRQFITSGRLQILNLLLSSYDVAVRKNEELEEAGRALREANESLEARVADRTAHLHREIERRRNVEAKLQKQLWLAALLESAAATANTSRTARNATQEIVRTTCEMMGWPLGHFYHLRDDQSNDLESSGLWYSRQDDDFDPFIQCTRDSPFLPGEGLAGRVFQSGKPIWIAGVDADPTFTRTRGAQACGIRTALAVPVSSRNQVIGVLEFFHTDLIPVDMDLLRALQQACFHLSHMYERESASRDLAEREAFLQSILDNSTAVIYAKDLDGHYITVNRTLEKLVGCDRAQLRGKTDYDLFPRTVADRLTSNDRAVLYSRSAHEAEEIVDIDGESRTFLSLKYPIFDPLDRIVAVGGHSMDITDRIRAEEHRRLMSEALEQSTAGIVLASVTGDVVLTNPAIRGICGLEESELQHISDLDLGRAEADDMTVEDLWRTLKSGQRETGIITFSQFTGGSERILGVRASRVEGPSGSVSHYLFFIRDTTSERALERQIHRKHRLESIGGLAGGIAHDFNNILAVIQGFVEIAQTNLHDPEQARDDLNQVRAAAQRAEMLIQQILRFSRSEAGKRELLDIGDITQEIIELARVAVAKTIELKSVPGSSCKRVAADAAQIEQVLLNLITNAAHAIGPNSGIIEVRTDPCTIEPGDEYIHPDLSPQEYVRITVADNGCGMSQRTLEKIFDPFFTTKGPDEGTGLGLSNSHAIIRDHDGAITVYSEEGVGTEFHIYLPVSEDESPIAAAAGEDEPRGAGSERIITVDDEEVLLLLNKRRLEDYGYQVTAMSSAQQALAAIEANPEGFDLLVSDSSMPGMHGEELAGKVQAIAPHLPVLIVSGYSGKVGSGPMPDNVKGFLAKPLPQGMLLSSVRSILDGERGPR